MLKSAEEESLPKIRSFKGSLINSQNAHLIRLFELEGKNGNQVNAEEAVLSEMLASINGRLFYGEQLSPLDMKRYINLNKRLLDLYKSQNAPVWQIEAIKKELRYTAGSHRLLFENCPALKEQMMGLLA
jgi:hypothetical protein